MSIFAAVLIVAVVFLPQLQASGRPRHPYYAEEDGVRRHQLPQRSEHAQSVGIHHGITGQAEEFYSQSSRGI